MTICKLPKILIKGALQPAYTLISARHDRGLLTANNYKFLTSYTPMVCNIITESLHGAKINREGITCTPGDPYYKFTIDRDVFNTMFVNDNNNLSKFINRVSDNMLIPIVPKAKEGNPTAPYFIKPFIIKGTHEKIDKKNIDGTRLNNTKLTNTYISKVHIYIHKIIVEQFNTKLDNFNGYIPVPSNYYKELYTKTQNKKLADNIYKYTINANLFNTNNLTSLRVPTDKIYEIIPHNLMKYYKKEGRYTYLKSKKDINEYFLNNKKYYTKLFKTLSINIISHIEVLDNNYTTIVYE